MRRPRPLGSCHQCCTSPSTNWRPAARSRCSRARSGRASDERHHVLELIAEAERAARLVVAARAPRAGSSRPGRAASGSSAGRTSRPACAPGRRRASRPTTRRTASQRGLAPRRRAVARDRARARASRSVALAQQEHEPARLARARARPRPAAPRTDRARRRSGPRARRGRSAAGCASEPLRPRNDARSPVADASGSLACANATRPANSWL